MELSNLQIQTQPSIRGTAVGFQRSTSTPSQTHYQHSIQNKDGIRLAPIAAFQLPYHMAIHSLAMGTGNQSSEMTNAPVEDESELDISHSQANVRRLLLHHNFDFIFRNLTVIC